MLLALLLGIMGPELSESLSDSLYCSAFCTLGSCLVVDWSGMVWVSLDRLVTGSLMVDCTSSIVEAGLSTGVERITHSSSSLLSPSPVMCSGEGSLANEGASLFLMGLPS